MSANFVPNPAFPLVVMVQPLAHAMFASLGDEAEALSRQLAPVDTGALYDSIGHEPVPGPEAGTRLFAGTDHWSFAEFGTSHWSGQPFLRPVIDALGLHH